MILLSFCALCSSLIDKIRQVIGSYEVAKETAAILRQAVSMTRWRDADALLDIIRELGARLTGAQPKG